MMAAITPGKQVGHVIQRQKTVDLKLVEMTKIDIIDYHFSFAPRDPAVRVE